MKRILPVSLAVLLFVILVQPSYAHHRKQVLGEATSAAEVEFPPVTAGAGFFLPDSPLYALDTFFQNFRLATSFTPEQKAKVRAQVAQERLAELRVMMSKNNDKGIETALTQLTKETGAAAEHLNDAHAKGRDVSELAKEINDTIKTQREVLHSVEKQTEGAMQLKFKTARAELKEAKVTVEDSLAEDELEKEIEANLQEDIDEQVADTEDMMASLEDDVTTLEKEADEAAAKSLEKREAALREAIEKKEQEKANTERRLLETEKRKQAEMKKVNKEAAQQAKKTMEEARETAKMYEEARKKREELRKEEAEKVKTTERDETEN